MKRREGLEERERGMTETEGREGERGEKKGVKFLCQPFYHQSLISSQFFVMKSCRRRRRRRTRRCKGNGRGANYDRSYDEELGEDKVMQ
jgi:hypothetical protein